MKIFWAWQFDRPGKISRHFIRGALEEAIARINQDLNIDEPDEAFQDALQLDYGRKGLKGSPDRAIEILNKIDGCSVFVGDVTPVGMGAPHTTDEGIESPGKPLMNPNVAIELGYALKSKTTANVLMVMNGHYGRRADMPFDLGRKAGPIMYRLSPEATKQKIEAERAKLVSTLVEALREYVPEPAVEPFPEMQPKIGKGIYFEDGEVLGELKNRDGAKFVMSARSVAWLRVIPRNARIAANTLDGRRTLWRLYATRRWRSDPPKRLRRGVPKPHFEFAQRTIVLWHLGYASLFEDVERIQ